MYLNNQFYPTNLILIRGLPGSGKSTLAKLLNPDKHFEADMFFESLVDNGFRYDYNPLLIKEAHEWCFRKTEKAVKANLGKRATIIVSNTFVRRWEMGRYLDLGREFNIPVSILVARGEYQNIHGVPPEKVEQMREQWED